MNWFLLIQGIFFKYLVISKNKSSIRNEIQGKNFHSSWFHTFLMDLTITGYTSNQKQLHKLRSFCISPIILYHLKSNAFYFERCFWTNYILVNTLLFIHIHYMHIIIVIIIYNCLEFERRQRVILSFLKTCKKSYVRTLETARMTDSSIE